jgi:aminopeptidase N
VISLNRGFSAPVAIASQANADDLLFLAANDDDPFARYEAMQQLVCAAPRRRITGGLSPAELESGRAARSSPPSPRCSAMPASTT